MLAHIRACVAMAVSMHLENVAISNHPDNSPAHSAVLHTRERVATELDWAGRRYVHRFRRVCLLH